jgi:hypothetical protein
MSNIYVQEAEQLIGKKVTGVIELNATIKDNFMWDGRSGDSAIAIVFEGGTMVIPMKDDEGNGAGVLMYTNVLGYAQMTTMRADMFAP